MLFSDGACLGNPGPGGYGVILAYGEHRRELSGGFRKTTNNRMEVTAAIIPNADLWDQVLRLIEFHQVAVEWTRGHAGHPENERCDLLARTAASSANLRPDVGYEKAGNQQQTGPDR